MSPAAGRQAALFTSGQSRDADHLWWITETRLKVLLNGSNQEWNESRCSGVSAARPTETPEHQRARGPRNLPESGKAIFGARWAWRYRPDGFLFVDVPTVKEILTETEPGSGRRRETFRKSGESEL